MRFLLLYTRILKVGGEIKNPPWADVFFEELKEERQGDGGGICFSSVHFAADTDELPPYFIQCAYSFKEIISVMKTELVRLVPVPDAMDVCFPFIRRDKIHVYEMREDSRSCKAFRALALQKENQLVAHILCNDVISLIQGEETEKPAGKNIRLSFKIAV